MLLPSSQRTKHRGILNKTSLGPFRPVRPAGLDFQARPGPRAVRPVAISTIYSTIRVCIAAHSAQRVANRFCNNMSMTVFQAFPQSLRYSQCGSQVLASVVNSHLHITAKSIRNTLCVVSCNACTVYRAVARLLAVWGGGREEAIENIFKIFLEKFRKNFKNFQWIHNKF